VYRIGFVILSSLVLVSSHAKADDSIDYLVQLNCAGTNLQDSTTPQCWRKHDWGNYQISDSYIRQDGFVVQTFDFSPFGTMEIVRDGGQILRVQSNGTVVVAETRDGGKPYEQYFVGERCFDFKTWTYGTGWIVWKSDVNQSPRSTIATLADSDSLNKCPHLSRALTRYWSGQGVWFPFDLGSGLVYKNLDLVVSEHYNNASIDASINMERMYFSRHAYGLVAWEAWSKIRSPGDDISVRCPETPWRHTPEGDGYKLVDCRVWTNIVPDNFVPTSFSWP
jgi:hypothetical protein